MRIISISLFACLTISSVNAANLTGGPRISDGDTLYIGSTKVRLDRIDAPETDQICLNGSGQRWTCGIEARDKLTAHIAGQDIKCLQSGYDFNWHRPLAVCYLGEEDLNAWMVQEG